MENGSELVAKERTRQITDEGFDAVRDAHYVKGELVSAAACYAAMAQAQVASEALKTPTKVHPAIMMLWPWSESWWKPSRDPVRNLEKAGALIAAEIDRIRLSREK